MTDSKNKTKTSAKTKAATETQTVDVAPYMKKGHQTEETSKSNILIPLILVVVVTTIIIATFFEDEYKGLVAQASSVTDSTIVSASTNASLTEEITSTVNSSIEPASEKLPPGKQVVSTDDAQAKNTEVATQTADTAEETNISQPALAIATIAAAEIVETAPANNRAATRSTSSKRPMPDQYAQGRRHPYANKQAYDIARKEAMAHSQEQKRKHDEMMQQRRHAYEEEMKSRREQYDTAKKAQQERREKIAEMQKNLFQQVKKNRIETRLEMEQMHKQLTDMHKKMHQMMRDSRPQYRNNSAAQKQDLTAEQKQSIK